MKLKLISLKYGTLKDLLTVLFFNRWEEKNVIPDSVNKAL